MNLAPLESLGLFSNIDQSSTTNALPMSNAVASGSDRKGQDFQTSQTTNRLSGLYTPMWKLSNERVADKVMNEAD